MLFQYWSIVAPFAWQVHLACRWKSGGAHQVLFLGFPVVCGTDWSRDDCTSGFVFLCSSSSLVCGTIAPLHTCGKQGGKGKGRQLCKSAVRQVEQCPSLQHSTTLATNIFTPHDCFLLNIAKMPSMPFLIETNVIEVCCAAGGEFTTGPFTLQVPLSLALARLCNSRRRRENQFPLLFLETKVQGRQSGRKTFCSAHRRAVDQ